MHSSVPTRLLFFFLQWRVIQRSLPPKPRVVSPLHLGESPLARLRRHLPRLRLPERVARHPSADRWESGGETVSARFSLGTSDVEDSAPSTGRDTLEVQPLPGELSFLPFDPRHSLWGLMSNGDTPLSGTGRLLCLSFHENWVLEGWSIKRRRMRCPGHSWTNGSSTGGLTVSQEHIYSNIEDISDEGGSLLLFVGSIPPRLLSEIGRGGRKNSLSTGKSVEHDRETCVPG